MVWMNLPVTEHSHLYCLLTSSLIAVWRCSFLDTAVFSSLSVFTAILMKLQHRRTGTEAEMWRYCPSGRTHHSGER